MKPKIIFIILFSILPIIFINAQDGWNKTKQNDALVYTPSNIKEGITYRVTIYAPVNLYGQSLKERILAKAKQEQASLGKVLHQWKYVIPEKDGTSWTNNKFIDANGEKINVVYVGGFLKNGKAVIYQVVHSLYNLKNRNEFKKYGTQTQLNNLLKDAGVVFVNNPSLVNSKKINKNEIGEKTNPSKKITYKEKKKVIRTDPNQGVKPTEIEALINYYSIRTSRNNVYLLLNDGNIYKGLNIPPSDFNVLISKKIEPEKWFKWQKKAINKYQIATSDGWKDLKGWKLPKTKSGKRFNLTLKSVSGSTSNYYKNVSVRKNFLILQPDGRFEAPSIFKHSNTDAVGIAMTSSSSKGKSGGQTTTYPGNSKKQITGKGIGSDAVGSYKIDGYTIEFQFDSGRLVRELFWESIEDKTYLYIGKKLFYVPD